MQEKISIDELIEKWVKKEEGEYKKIIEKAKKSIEIYEKAIKCSYNSKNFIDEEAGKRAIKLLEDLAKIGFDTNKCVANIIVYAIGRKRNKSRSQRNKILLENFERIMKESHLRNKISFVRLIIKRLQEGKNNKEEKEILMKYLMKMMEIINEKERLILFRKMEKRMKERIGISDPLTMEIILKLMERYPEIMNYAKEGMVRRTKSIMEKENKNEYEKKFLEIMEKENSLCFRVAKTLEEFEKEENPNIFAYAERIREFVEESSEFIFTFSSVCVRKLDNEKLRDRYLDLIDVLSERMGLGIAFITVLLPASVRNENMNTVLQRVVENIENKEILWIIKDKEKIDGILITNAKRLFGWAENEKTKEVAERVLKRIINEGNPKVIERIIFLTGKKRNTKNIEKILINAGLFNGKVYGAIANYERYGKEEAKRKGKEIYEKIKEIIAELHYGCYEDKKYVDFLKKSREKRRENKEKRQKKKLGIKG